MGQFEKMQVFVRIVEAGAIGIAAEQLAMAKSAVSRQLTSLEQSLGVKLINRTTRSLNITDAGNVYYHRAIKILNEVKELNNQASSQQMVLRGTLRLAVPVSFGLTHLSPALSKFMKLHPELTLDVDFSDQHINLISGGYDLAFRIGELDDSTLKSRHIAPINFVICGSQSYFNECGRPELLSDLKHHKLLGYSLLNTNTWRLLDDDGNELLLPVEPRLTANNGDFLTQMAASGHGIVIAPTFIASQPINKGDLIPILTNYKIQPSYAQVVYPNTRYLSHKVRVLIDFLIQQFGDIPYWDRNLGLS